ncbi:MAG: LON peptidase substrate-binding domain-containing protein [Planctomycetota bacterium]
METALAHAPLFPLPHGALLPGELLPFHVFEARYRAMLAVVRKGDGMLAVATLLPGWETDTSGTPPISEIVGMGRVVKAEQRPDGTSDIVVHGLVRGEVLSEAPGGTRTLRYRLARILPRPDGEQHPAELWRLRRALLTGLARRLRTRAFKCDLTAGFDAGALADRIAASLDLRPQERASLMHAADAGQRIERLLEMLRDRRHRQRLIEIIPSLHAFSLALQRGRGSEGSP